MKTEKSCGCIILKDNQVLLIGAKDDDGKLFWSFPKGHQENGETDIETAIRETKEETGLDVEISDIAPIKTGHFIHGGTAYKSILLFIAKPLNSNLNPQEGEVESINWVQIDEAEKRITLDYYREAWKEALKRFNEA
jgi:8-oxo-dGTP pyrophosphatase MutT (NUDIX family)